MGTAMETNEEMFSLVPRPLERPGNEARKCCTAETPDQRGARLEAQRASWACTY